MAKDVQIAVRLSGEQFELFEACRLHLAGVKERAGLDPETSISEVLRHAMLCMAEKHGLNPPKRTRRAV